MCGITGWVDFNKELNSYQEIIIKMGETLLHRGPDSTGYWVTKHAAFAHTRLIVIDPEGGKQPMIRQFGDEKYVIIYNGELYNTDELRKELEALGHKFLSYSDTEVLLVSYIEWKEGCVNHLNGIFAFAIWDDFRQSLFIARDRLGVKPLFYSAKSNNIVFGSEIKALLAHPEIHPIIDKEGLSEIFGLGPSRTPGHGVFKDIKELRPGHFLVFKRGKLDIKKYWSLESKPHSDNLDTTIYKVKELVYDAVKRQLVSDVPVCTFLSGGLDSSIISAIAADIYKNKGERIDTYSIDYVGNKENFKQNEFQPNSDEPWVKLMSAQIASNHHYIYLDTQELISALRESVIARDLPGMADVDSSLYLFSKKVKEKATVGLSGECADEIFGGYPWFYRKEDLFSNTFPWIRSIKEREKILKTELKNELNIVGYVNQRYEETLKEVPRLIGESELNKKMRELFYLNITWFMTTLLDRKDRMTMATGLEVRVPFADHRIVEYVWNIPWEIKNLNNREKGLLRNAVAELLPKEIVFRKKSPYPKTHNPSYTKAVSEEMISILDNSSAKINQIINKKFVYDIAKTGGESFRTPWYGQLMTGPQLLAYLIQVHIWLEEYNISIL